MRQYYVMSARGLYHIGYEDFIFGTDFADKMGWNELDDIRRTNGICDFF